MVLLSILKLFQINLENNEKQILDIVDYENYLCLNRNLDFDIFLKDYFSDNTNDFDLAYKNYREMVYGIFVAPEADTTPKDLRPFPYKVKYVEAVDYYSPDVRNYAVSLIMDDSLKKYVADYHDYRKLIQCFAVFKFWTNCDIGGVD